MIKSMKYRVVYSSVVVVTLLGSLLVSAFSMSPFGVDPEEYLKVFNANKISLSQKTTVNSFEYSLMYVPNELRLISLEKKGALTDEIYKEFTIDRKNYMEFLLQINIPNSGANFLDYASNEEDSYEDKLKYYSFTMKEDILIILDGADTLNCSEYVFERNFGASPKGSFTIGFSDISNFNTIEIRLTNKMMGNDPVVFNFSKKELEVLPTLKNYKKWKR